MLFHVCDLQVLKIQTSIQGSKVLKLNRLPWCSHPHTVRPQLCLLEVGLIKVELPTFPLLLETVLYDFSLHLPRRLIIKQISNVGVALLDLVPILEELGAAALVAPMALS